MARDGQENFLRRWSRRKLESAVEPAVPEGGAPPAAESVARELPALDSLTFESDFEAFMRAKIDERLRRAALKKLFADPRFNVMDGLDVYIDDYAEGEAIPPELLARLQHARSTLFGPDPQAPVESAAGTGSADVAAPDSAPTVDADGSRGTDGAAG